MWTVKIATIVRKNIKKIRRSKPLYFREIKTL